MSPVISESQRITPSRGSWMQEFIDLRLACVRTHEVNVVVKTNYKGERGDIALAANVQASQTTK